MPFEEEIYSQQHTEKAEWRQRDDDHLQIKKYSSETTNSECILILNFPQVKYNVMFRPPGLWFFDMVPLANKGSYHPSETHPSSLTGILRLFYVGKRSV